MSVYILCNSYVLGASDLTVSLVGAPYNLLTLAPSPAWLLCGELTGTSDTVEVNVVGE